MRKLIKPERVAGIVALSYLVLIPAAGAFFYRRLLTAENNVEDIWTRIQEIDPKGSWADRG